MTENEKSAWCRVFFTSIQGSAGANPWVASTDDLAVFGQHATDVLRTACLIADMSVDTLNERGMLVGTISTATSAVGANELLALVEEASEIMDITYAGNFPAGIESFLVRAAEAIAKAKEFPRHGQAIGV